MAITTITVPEAGENLRVQVTGLSIYVVNAPAYSSALDAPRLSFENPGGGFPLLLGSVIGSDIGKFGNLIITGTEASAGNEISLLSMRTCQPTNLNLPDSGTAKIKIGPTKLFQSSNEVKRLEGVDIADSDGFLPNSILIQCRDNDISYLFGGEPDQTNRGYILQASKENQQKGSLIELNGIDRILKFRFISASIDTPGRLLITPEY